jgi:hypothetical protein
MLLLWRTIPRYRRILCSAIRDFCAWFSRIWQCCSLSLVSRERFTHPHISKESYPGLSQIAIFRFTTNLDLRHRTLIPRTRQTVWYLRHAIFHILYSRLFRLPCLLKQPHSLRPVWSCGRQKIPQHFGDWICLRPQVDGAGQTYSVGPVRKS